jgi:RNA polymerase sigma-70 factor, ECF subfamily
MPAAMAAPRPAAPAATIDPAQLAQLRQPLMRFAQLHLRDAGAAEDVVSETLLALIEKPMAFEGRSSLRTYATGILKFKIVDHLRLRRRELPIETAAEQTLDEAIDALFAANGHWRERQPAWQQPEQALELAQFHERLQACVERLPARTATVFMMREALGREVEDICAELGISANHCGVMLYRARMALRGCLQRHWFGMSP